MPLNAARPRRASRCRGRFELRRLFDLADLALLAGLALERQLRLALVVTRRRDGHDGQFVLAVGERIVERERAVGTQFDRLAVNGDFGIRLGRGRK